MCAAVSVTDDDDDRRRRAKQYWPHTLCVGGPVIGDLIIFLSPGIIVVGWCDSSSLMRNHVCYLVRVHIKSSSMSCRLAVPCIKLITIVQSNMARDHIVVLSANAFIRSVSWTAHSPFVGMLLSAGICPLLKSSPSREGSRPHPIHGSLDQHESAPERHLDRFCRFCTAHSCAQCRGRQTDTQTTLRATSVATAASVHCVYAMRPKINK